MMKICVLTLVFLVVIATIAVVIQCTWKKEELRVFGLVFSGGLALLGLLVLFILAIELLSHVNWVTVTSVGGGFLAVCKAMQPLLQSTLEHLSRNKQQKLEEDKFEFEKQQSIQIEEQ